MITITKGISSMNIVNTLTKKHMQKNKRRTIVTILGIMISVAMFTAVTTFATSFMGMMQINYNRKNGDWHVRYENLNEENIPFLKKQDNSAKVIPKYHLQTMNLESQAEEPISFSINTLDQNGFHEMITLSEGTYPTNDTEILLNEYYLRWYQIDAQIGSTITLTNDDEVREYTVVGLAEYTFTNRTNLEGLEVFTYTTTDTVAKSESLYAYVTLQSVSKAVYQDSEALAREMGITNSNTLYSGNLIYYRVSNNNNLITALTTIGLIIMGVIMIGSVMLIYNAFAISLSERSKHLGMLSSIGATKKQKRHSVFYEGYILGLFSIMFGLLLGVGGMAITFLAINPILENTFELIGFPLKVSFIGIAIAVTFAIITIFISTYIPAKKAGKISPIEALRSSHDIKLSKRTVKTNRLTKTLFGFEGTLALKNIKRNKKRYYVTVISLIVSVILFLSVSGFTYYFQDAFNMSQETINYDALSSTEDPDIATELLNVKNVTSAARTSEHYIHTPINLELINPHLLTLLEENDQLYEDEFYINLNIKKYDRKYLEQYYKDHKIEPGSIIINQTNVIPISRSFKELSLLKGEPQSLSLYYQEYDHNTDTTEDKLLHLENIVYTNDLPIGTNQPYSHNSLEVIVPDDMFFTTETIPWYTIYYQSNNGNALDSEVTEIISQQNSNRVYYHNIQNEVNAMNQMFLIINVFAYGFITLISLISIANIFNTITTSVSLRTKEFAMLKSIGMTPKSFHRMIYFESIFYGLNTLLIAIPISIVIMYFMHNSLISVFYNSFSIPFTNIAIAVIAVFIIVGSTLLFSTSKIRKQNIIDGLRTENI